MRATSFRARSNPLLEVALGQRKAHVNGDRCQTVDRAKVNPGVIALPQVKQLFRIHVNRPLIMKQVVCHNQNHSQLQKRKL